MLATSQRTRRGRSSSHRRSCACCEWLGAALSARRGRQGSPRRNRLDVFYQHRYIGSRGSMVVEVAAASTREAPLRRRCTQATVASSRLGQPFSQARCRAMAFAHQRRQRAGRWAAIAPGGAPDGGNPGKMSKQQPGLLPRDAFAHQRRQRAGCWAAIARAPPDGGNPGKMSKQQLPGDADFGFE